MVKIAPSLLAADFSTLTTELAKVSTADMLHVDIMDGRFVPNISIGPAVVSAIRPKTALKFDVHLMLRHPMKFIPAFAKAGADMLTFHVECADDPAAAIEQITSLGLVPGLAVSPDTPISALPLCAESVPMFTVMTVYPGFGGQKLIPGCLDKVAELKSRFPGAQVEIDGGVNLATAPACAAAGADVLVAGTAVFGAEDPAAMISLLRG